jgi:phosphatidylcholine synthase
MTEGPPNSRSASDLEKIASPSPGHYSWSRTVCAWGVHLFTASGAVCCLLSIDAGVDHLWREAFTWLALAVLIDAIDGALARAVGVKKVLPHFSGEQLDNVVDYASYVLVPAFLLHRAELLPASCSWYGSAGIVLASAYQFCQSDAKTSDHYFKGFPSYWNIAVLYLLALNLSPASNLLIILALIVLVFVPIRYVYPSRTPHFRALTVSLGGLWGVALIWIVWSLPSPPSWLVHVSLLFCVYYFGLSLFLEFRHRYQRD